MIKVLILVTLMLTSVASWAQEGEVTGEAQCEVSYYSKNACGDVDPDSESECEEGDWEIDRAVAKKTFYEDGMTYDRLKMTDKNYIYRLASYFQNQEVAVQKLSIYDKLTGKIIFQTERVGKSSYFNYYPVDKTHNSVKLKRLWFGCEVKYVKRS